MNRFAIIYCRICLLLLSVSIPTKAQQWQLLTHRLDSADNKNTIALNNDYKNAQDLITALNNIVPDLQQQGYLAASIDSIGITGNSYTVYYYRGQRYKWGKLSFDSIPQAVLIGAGINPLQYTNRPLNPKVIAHISEKLLNHCDENGYPFARVWLSNLKEISAELISAEWNINREELRRIDTVIINGEITVSPSFLLRYLDIAQGSLYNEQKLKNISQRLSELAFLQESAPWFISFKPGDTRLSLFLKEKKANQLNAILGLMPNNLQTGKLLVTADVQVALQNKLGHGESISASYQNLQPKSPRIKADVVVPYLLKSPIGAEAHFDLFTNGLQFRKVTFQTGLRYQINTNDYIRLYYQIVSNRIIEIDTASILATKQLPANIDSRSGGLGFELLSNHTDYRLNPHKGWQGKIGATAFQRKVIVNNAIGGLRDGTGFDYNTLYDTLKKTSYQYNINADIALFVPLGRNLTLKIAYVGGYIAAPRIFQNELFQIGGFKLLRGFDEQSIFANQYHISVTELRVRLSRNSFAYLFSDNGWLQTKFNTYNRAGWYNGFGLGTTLETKSGLFSIGLGFGRNDFSPLRFRESKISFGYIALF